MTSLQALVDRVHATRKALPADRFRFLVPDANEKTDLDYLAILVVLHDAANSGTGDLPRGELEDLANRAVETFRDEPLSAQVMEARLKSLEKWELIEKQGETQVEIKLSEWSRGYQRYRISDDGALIIDLLLSAQSRKRRVMSSQDASNILSNIEASLDRLAQSDQEEPASAKERNERLRMEYLTLQGVVERDYENLLQYLRDLNKQVLNFGLSRKFNADEFRLVVDRLEAYMIGIHQDFRARSKRIVATCEWLAEPEALGRLERGYHLAQEEDKIMLFHAAEANRPHPADLLKRLTDFFDPSRKQSLTAEVVRIRNNTTIIVGRLRDHWQRILERTSFVQQLEQAWTRLQAARWDDEASWERALEWNAHIFEVRPIATAPDLGDEATPGRPPVPRRRYSRRGRNDEIAEVKPRESSLDAIEREEEALAARLNELITTKLLQGRASALLSELPLESHQEFRDIVQIAKNTDILLATPIAKNYFDFTAEIIPDAPRVRWERHDAAYEAPEIRFVRRSPRGEKQHA